MGRKKKGSSIDNVAVPPSKYVKGGSENDGGAAPLLLYGGKNSNILENLEFTTVVFDCIFF